MNYSTSADYSATARATASPLVMMVYFALIALLVVSMWKVFTKAGKPGWASLVPIYNIYVMLQIAGKPAWWLLLFLIPLVNIYAIVMTYLAIAKAFGKGTGFALGMIFLSGIFWPILAFSDAKYLGPDGGSAPTPAAPAAPTPTPAA